LVQLLEKLAIELEHPLTADIQIFQDGRCVRHAGLIGHHQHQPQHGNVRLRFRPTGSSARFLFFADSLFDPDSRTPTFSGFQVRGDVQEVRGVPEARFTTWLVKREDEQWASWL
jgi:hypothetical protein